MKEKHEKEIVFMRSDRVGFGRMLTVAIAATVFAGWYFMFFSSIGVTVQSGLAVLIGLCSCVAFVLFSDRKKIKYILFGAFGVLTVVLAIINAVGFWGSIIGLLRAVVAAVNANMHYGISSPVAANNTVFSDFALAAAISIWMGVGAAFAVRSSVALLLSTTLYSLFLVCFGLFPHPAAVVPTFFATVCKCITGNAMSVKTASITAVLFAVVSGLSALGFLYDGSEAISNVRRSVADAASNIAYGDDTLPGGRLKAAGELNSDADKTRLIVTLSGSTPTLYLKGFVGSEFDGTEWCEPDKNIYVTDENRGLMNYLGEAGIPFMQYSKYLALSNVMPGGYTVEVENVDADSEYVYVPYGLSDCDVGTGYYDLNIRRSVFSPKKYSYTVFTGDSSSERVIQQKWVTSESGRTQAMREYLVYDGEYRRFVYDNYVNLSADRRKKVFDKLGNADANSLFTVSKLIRTYFLGSYSYSTSPDAVSKDFVSEFFDGGIKKSNAVYFASAATLMFRAYGYPARYAEGYLIKTGGTTMTAAVKSANAHAWTEVYLDGIGWLPVEVSPTFFSESDLDDGPIIPDKPSGGDHTNVEPLPDEPQNPPDDPTDLPDPEDQTLTPEQKNLKYTLKTIVPIAAAVAALLAVVLVLTIRRDLTVKRKHEKLNTDGEMYGRAAMSTLERDLSSFGGYSREIAISFGVSEVDADRFKELIERAVYGGYDLTRGEREYTEKYISRLVNKAMTSKNKAYTIYCKYILCMGL